MKRVTLLLAGLGVLLIIVLWYLLIWSPRTDELETVEAQIADAQAQQAVARSRITALRGVREVAPQLQADLVAAETLLPRETALPSALRQLQQAADDAGATLVSVSPGRPSPVEGGGPQLYEMTLSAEIRGTYFQIVDVLRRIEDPAITPRGVLWDSMGLNISDAPELSASLGGRMFALLPDPPAPEPDPVEGVPADDAEEDADVEVDVDVDVEEPAP